MLALVVVTLASCAKAREVDEVTEGPLGPADELTDDEALEEEVLGGDPSESEPPGEAADEDDANPAAIDEPEPIVGATISVTGTVDEVVDENAFEIAARGQDGGGFLVLVADDDVAVADVVEVTGTVREPDFDQLRSELDFEIDQNLYSQSDRQLVIVAETVEVVGQAAGG